MDNSKRCFREKNRDSKKIDDFKGSTIGGKNGYGVPTNAESDISNVEIKE